MIIDSHVHLRHGDAARTEYSPEEIVRLMDGAGIDKSVVFAIRTSTPRSIEMADAAAREFPDRLIPYVYAVPTYSGDVLGAIEQAVKELGFRGIKIHAGESSLAEYVTDPVFALAGKLGVPCLVDCRGRYDDMKRLAEKFPETRIIIAHLGIYLTTDQKVIDSFIQLAAEHENIVLDVSGVVIYWKIREAVERVGARRVVFGTDGPHKAPDLVTFAQIEIEKIRMLRLAPEDEKAVLGGTIAAILALKR